MNEIDKNNRTEATDSIPRMENLITLANEIVSVLQKIQSQNHLNQKENSENGRMEFAYVEYYLAEVSSLLNLSVYLLRRDSFQKYTYFPARQIMEIVLQLEHVYSIKNKKGLNGVRRLFFKDITASAKLSLSMPGDSGKDKINSHLSLLDIVSKILKLDFKTEDVSEKSNRDIKPLCDKSCIVIKRCTGSELYNFYQVLCDSSHANVLTIGVSNHENDVTGALNIFEISIELGIRFCEIIINESKYEQLVDDVKNIKRIAGIE